MKHVTFHLPSFLRRVRIHGGEFDSSARAMNREKQVRLLQADLRIVRGSTIERKQMSTKTTLKRISLVAVAALGLSLVAVAPSSAVPQVDTLTASALTATAAPGAAASVTLTHTYLSTGTSDTVTATVSIQSMPAANTALPVLASVTTNDTGSPAKVISGLTASTGSVAASTAVRGDYTLSLTTLTTGTYVFVVTPQSGSKASALTLTYTIADTAAAPTATASRVYMRSTSLSCYGTLTAASLLVDGANCAQTAKIDETGTVTYTQATLKTNLVAHIAAADTNTANVTTLSVSGGISTVGNTVATFGVILGNGESLTASTISGAVQKSYDPYTPQAGYYFNAPGHPVTATVTGPGLIAYGGVTKGKTYTEASTDGQINYLQKTFSLVSDGTNGASTITFTAGGVTLATRTVNFVGTATGYVFGTPTKSVTGVGETSSVTITGTDSLGTTTGAASVYAFSSDTSVATVNSTQASTVVVTGVKSGTATITVGNASTIATSTITKTLAIKVGALTAKTVTLTLSPAAPTAGEKVTVTVTALDASGNAVGDGVRALYAAGGYSPSVTVNGSTLPTTTTETLTAGVATYVFYAPSAGTVTFTATEGSATDSTTKGTITGSVTVSNPGLDAATDAANEAIDAANAATDAALAAAEAADAATTAAQEASDAVAALSESVTKLIAGLQAQIKSLAAVVAKIAKKVKA